MLVRLSSEPNLLAVLFKLAVSAVRLQFLAGFESNRLTRGDRNFFARSRIAANSTLARLHDKDPKPAQFDPVTARQSILHRCEQCFDSLLGFQFRNSGFVGETIDNVEFNHCAASEL